MVWQFMKMEEFMKDHGQETREMEEDSNFFLMEILIKVNINKVKQMEKEHILGEMQRYMMETG